MAFNQNDLYLVSGSSELYNSWTSTVTKFDSSSFYNWEQDNLPLHDLEERTQYLWDKLGYPVQDGFSGIPGVCLAVSADAFRASFGPFSSLPGSVDSSGNVFRNVSAAIAALPNPITYPIIIEVASFGDLGSLDLNGIHFRDNGGLEIVNRAFGKIVAGETIRLSVDEYGSQDLYDTILEASAVCLSALVTSSTTDPRWDDNLVQYVADAPFSSATSHLTGSAIIEFGHSAWMDGDEDFTFTPYDDGTVDVSSFHGVSGGAITRTAPTYTSDNAAGLLFGNYFRSINIQNCPDADRLFLRGFCVDGLDSSSVNTGFRIRNSDIVLENSLATRCREAGFSISDSRVVANRGLVAMRNYEVSSGTKVSTSTVGVELINSLLEVSGNQYGSGIDLLFQTAYNDVGVRSFNSTIRGGNSRKDSTGFTRAGTYQVSFLQSFFNVTGLELINTVLDYNGRVDVFNNKTGLELRGGSVKLEEIAIENNESVGIWGCEADIFLNKTGYQFPATPDGAAIQQFEFTLNGQHLKMAECTMSYLETSSLPTTLGKTVFTESHGATSSESLGRTSLPGIELDACDVDLFHAKIEAVSDEDNFGHTQAVFGACLNANYSNINFKGSKNGVTYIVGPPTYNAQKHVAAVYGAGSNIEFAGPTVIGQAAVDVLADGSEVAFRPHLKGGSLDASGWDLDDHLNHTRVELFSTRACLVGNNSEIIMEDLGDFHAFWAGSLTSAVDYNLADEFQLSTFTASGYMQFYPNGQDSDMINTVSTRHTLPTPGFEGGLTNAYLMLDHVGDEAGVLNYSTGGMCVRALKGSSVKANNVHFPAGWYNASGAVYDVSAGNCERLYIWNIVDDSTLQVSHATVSGMYPSLAGYNGPSAVWELAGAEASEAATWVVDTGVKSVLDDFGASAGNVGTNYGPFRIYVSTKGPAKWLQDAGASAYGSPAQCWSQGYNPSGPVSADVAVSSTYLDHDGQNLVGMASAFFTTSSFVDGGCANQIRLDESAADIFANAKNAARTRSGRIPIVSIYRSHAAPAGEGYDTETTGHGIGLLSMNIFDLKGTD